MQDELLRRIREYRPRPLEGEDRRYPEAAVLVPITRHEIPELVLTLRASNLSTHSGEVAFPGGRCDPAARSLADSAMSGADGGGGLAHGLVASVGPLSPAVSLHGIKGTPIGGMVRGYVEYRSNKAEIAAVFQVPLNSFLAYPP